MSVMLLRQKKRYGLSSAGPGILVQLSGCEMTRPCKSPMRDPGSSGKTANVLAIALQRHRESNRHRRIDPAELRLEVHASE